MIGGTTPSHNHLLLHLTCLSFLFLPSFLPVAEKIDRNVEDYQDDTPPLTHELKAYRALLSTASAIHRREFHHISLKVSKAMVKIKEAARITPELREEIRLLKIGVDAQCISVAGALYPIPSCPLPYPTCHFVSSHFIC